MKYKLLLFVLTLLVVPYISTAMDGWDQVATEITIGERKVIDRSNKVVIHLKTSPKGEIKLIRISLDKLFRPLFGIPEFVSIANNTFSLEGLFDPQGHRGTLGYSRERGVPLTLYPMNDFSPQTGGQFALRYSTSHFFHPRTYEVILSLVKDGSGTWYLANEQGNLLHNIHVKVNNLSSGIDQILDFSKAYDDRTYQRLGYALERNSPSLITRNPVLNVTQQANQVRDTESTLVTRVSIGEHSPLGPNDRYFNITLNQTKNGNIDSIRIRYINRVHYIFNVSEELSADNTFSLEQLFSPEGIPTRPLYHGQKAIPISLQGLDSFDPQKGGRFTIQYSTFHLFNQQRNHKVTLSLVKRDQNWYLADEQGIPLKEIRMKIDFFRNTPRIIGIPATADGRPYWTLNQPETPCAVLR